MANQGWQARDAWTGAGLLALFLLTRIFWLRELPDSSFYWEEAYRWVSMQEIVAGPVRPLLDYQADHYQGGSLAAILLARGIVRPATDIDGLHHSLIRSGAACLFGETPAPSVVRDEAADVAARVRTLLGFAD